MTGIATSDQALATEEKDKLTAAAATPSQHTPAHHKNRSVESNVTRETTEHPNNDRGTGSGERRVEEEKHRRLRARLERAIQSKDAVELEPAVEAVKMEKIPNCSELLDKVKYIASIVLYIALVCKHKKYNEDHFGLRMWEEIIYICAVNSYNSFFEIQAEKLLKKLYATRNLRDATVARRLTALEKAIDAVKEGGWEKDLQREMQEANALLEKVSSHRFNNQYIFATKFS